MPLVYLDALPHRTTKGTVVRLLIQVGGIARQKIGSIELQGRRATIEVPEGWDDRLVAALDGARLGDSHIRASRPHHAGAMRGVEHFERLIELLEMEADAEARQALQQTQRLAPEDAERMGNSLVQLVVVDEQWGLGGRILVSLAKRGQQPLPWTRLGVGSPVLLSRPRGNRQLSWRGVISERSSMGVQVALAERPEEADDVPFRLDLSGDEVARTRQRSALQRAAAAGGDRLAELRDVLLFERPPRFEPAVEFKTLDTSLNRSQRQAVQHALSAADVAVIHGPPGTGKTTAVVELIRQAVRRGERVLACAPSNLAVDNILERLLAFDENAMRLGHPARVLPQLRAHTLDLMVEQHDDVKLARKLMKQAAALRDRAGRYTRAKPEPGARREMRDEAKSLVADARRLESQVVHHLLDTTSIVCATTTGLDSEILGQRRFDLAVIDEACQSTEPGCWIPLLRSERVVLAGDHFQLPPTVVSLEAARAGFGVSLQERLVDRMGDVVSRQLVTQYRMHQSIMHFSSQQFYDGTLEADVNVRTHLLRDLPEVQDTDVTATPLLFIDTAGASFDEQREPEGASRRNPQEGELVERKVRELLDAGVAPNQLAVITPYAAQVRWLREQLAMPDLETDSVDGFQGREKEAVIISLVRSNTTGDIGFLADVRRMNVALTRARRKLIVIGDSATIAGHPFYASLLEYFEQQGAYDTVWNYL